MHRQDNPNRAALTEPAAADYIGMSPWFLRRDRVDGPRDGRTPGPPFVRIGRAVRYLKSDLDAWLLQHRVERDV
jgi:predicted DNA-binding transcriptional regulator AlpA